MIGRSALSERKTPNHATARLRPVWAGTNRPRRVHTGREALEVHEGQKKKAGNQFGFEWPLEARKGRRAAQKPPTHPNRRHQTSRPGTRIEPASAAPDATQHKTLAFPTFVTLTMQAGIIRILCGLPYADAQMLLDELHGAGQHTAIRNPIAYLRRLLRLHLAGTHYIKHSHRITALRAAQA
jgi:hypothetical protein